MLTGIINRLYMAISSYTARIYSIGVGNHGNALTAKFLSIM